MPIGTEERGRVNALSEEQAKHLLWFLIGWFEQEVGCDKVGIAVAQGLKWSEVSV